MFYFTRKPPEFHMGYITFNRSQHGQQWSPYKCLVYIKFPPIHEKESLGNSFNSCADSVLRLLQISEFLGVHAVLDVSPEEKYSRTVKIRASGRPRHRSTSVDPFVWEFFIQGRS